MKKHLFLGALALIALAACTKDVVKEVNPSNLIEFRSNMDRLTSRATSTTTDDLTSFYVTAYKGSAVYFEKVEFKKNPNSNFYSATPYYWPDETTDLDFYAYTPSGTDLSGTTTDIVTLDASGKTVAAYSPSTTIANQIDFLVGTATADGTSGANGVALTLNHQLSQIEIQAKESNDAYNFQIAGVRIAQIPSIANYTFPEVGTASGTWALTNTTGENYKAVYEFTYDTAVELGETAKTVMVASGDSDNAILIPQTLTAWAPTTDGTNTNAGAYIAVLLRITTSAGAQYYPSASAATGAVVTVGDYTYAWAGIGIGTTWEAGKKYTYILDFSSGAGYVDPTKPTPAADGDPWEPGDPIFKNQIFFTDVEVSDWTEGTVDVGTL